MVATGWPRGTGAGSMDEPALFVGSARLGVSRGISRGRGGHREHHIRGMQAKRVAFGWRLGGMCGVWANKTPPAKPLSCKALRHVWRLRRLFLTLIWKLRAGR